MLISQIYHNRFKQTPTLSNWFSYFSAKTWERLALSKVGSSVRYGEVTITENLVIELAEAMLSTKLPVRLFHAINEPQNGNDLEIVIPVGKDAYIILPCQAKVLYPPNDTYKQIDHISHKTGIRQIKKLREYAQKDSIKGHPMYLLYNNIRDKDYLKDNYKDIPSDPELFGCSIISAEFIFKNFCNPHTYEFTKIPTFKDLHMPAKPLNIIAESMNADFFSRFKEQYDDSINISVASYTESEIKKKGLWQEIDPSSITRNMPYNPLIVAAQSYDNMDVFEPKFRILLTH
jgi:hypothetical protein